jgi:hypothetical protein
MRFPPGLLLLSLASCLLLPLPVVAQEDNPPHLPTYAQCQTIESEKTPLKEKIFLELSFFPHKPICTLLSEPFMAHNVFNPGKTRLRLKLVMGKEDMLEIDRESLIYALLPDKDHIPRDRAHELTRTAAALISGMSGDAGSLTGMANGRIDPMNLIPLALKLGSFAGDIGRNAEIVEGMLELMRRKHGLGPEEAVCPSWLPGLKTLAGHAEANLAPAHLRGHDKGMQPDTSPLGVLQVFLSKLQKLFGQLPVGHLAESD